MIHKPCTYFLQVEMNHFLQYNFSFDSLAIYDGTSQGTVYTGYTTMIGKYCGNPFGESELVQTKRKKSTIEFLFLIRERITQPGWFYLY